MNIEFFGLSLLAGSTLLMLGIAVLVGSVFVHLAAKLSGVRYANFGKAFTATALTLLLSMFAGNLLKAALGWLGWLLSVLLTWLVFKWVYQTSLGRAVLIWVIMWLVVLFFQVVLMGGVLGTLLLV